jgi:hypothetical protein
MPRVLYGYGVQYKRCGTVRSAGVDTQTSSDEESDEEVGEEEAEGDGEFCVTEGKRQCPSGRYCSQTKRCEHSFGSN